MWSFGSHSDSRTGRRPPPDPVAFDAARVGGLWAGPNEAIWITRLLKGSPPPRPSPGHHVGPVAPS
jgi:hypothetical protein